MHLYRTLAMDNVRLEMAMSAFEGLRVLNSAEFYLLCLL
jgi:hypothetical protein